MWSIFGSHTFLPAVTLGAVRTVRSTHCKIWFPSVCTYSCGHCYLRDMYGILGTLGHSTSRDMWLPGKDDIPRKVISQEIWLPRKGDFPGKGDFPEKWLPGKADIPGSHMYGILRIFGHLYVCKCQLAQRGTFFYLRRSQQVYRSSFSSSFSFFSNRQEKRLRRNWRCWLCSSLFKIVPSCSILFKLVQTCPDLSRLVQTRPDSSRLVQTRLVHTPPDLPRLVNARSDSFILV